MTQQDVLAILKTGQSIFLTGPAGSGKTYLLNEYKDYLKSNKIETAVTATTGIAATHLNGRTIHSWCGLGIEEKLTDKQIDNLRDNENVFSRVAGTKVLIIDEISMLNASRLDLVNNICQALRQDLRPFGGLQIILCGDFFQLPPVTRRHGEDGNFVVDSTVWRSMDLMVCYLEEQYRQADQEFLKVLNAIRNNSVDEKIFGLLAARMDRPLNSAIKPTKLYTHNKNVEAENFLELQRLDGEERRYQMTQYGLPPVVKSLKDSYCLAPEILPLKISAVVMFVRNNFSRGYVNGTLGRVTGFDAASGYPIIETVAGRQIIANPETWAIEEGSKVIASVTQVPLRLAWAITVHKSQGLSLDCAEIDLSQTFEFGMGYVALSRVRSLAGIKLLGINSLALRVNSKVLELDKVLRRKSRRDLANHKKLGAAALKKTQKAFLKKSQTGKREGGLV